jgi:two-component system chemotaxis response regulator CheY
VQEGLELLKKWQVDAVTCDLFMPDIDGVQFLQQVRADPYWALLPVVMVTAGGKQDALDRACQNGANGVLTKPFSERQVIQMVETALS